MNFVIRTRVFLAQGFAVILTAQCGWAASGTWGVNASGTWELASNWLANGIADGVDATATFSNDPVGARTVTLGSPRTLGNLAFSDSDPLTAGTWAVAGTSPLTLSVAAGAPTISVTSLTATLAVPLAGMAFSKTGTGTLVLAGANAFTTPTLTFAAVSPGAIRVTSSAALGGIATVSMPGTNANLSRIELEGGVALTAKITTAGRSDLVFLKNLSGSNAWSGDISISNSGGGYTIESAAGVLTLGGIFNGISTARTLVLTGAGNGVVGGIIRNGSGLFGITKTGAGNWKFTAANTYSETTTVSAGQLEIGTGGRFGSGGVINNAEVIFSQADALVVANTISGTGKLRISGSGDLTLTAANTYAGGTLAFGIEASLSAAHDTAFGTGTVTLGDVPGSSQFWFHAAGNRTLANNFEIRSQRWIIDTNTINGIAAGSLTVTGDVYLNQSGARDIFCNKPLTLAGAVTSTGGMSKQGGFQLTLTGSATYGGATGIAAGTFAVDGTLTSPGTLTVSSGATLIGSGTITSPVSISGGGQLIPGQNKSGKLRTGSVTLAASSSVQFHAGAPGDLDNTQIVITGNLSMNGSLRMSDKSGLTTGTYTLATYTGTLTGTGFQSIDLPPGFIGNLVTSTPGQLKLQLIQAVATAPANNTMLSFTNSVMLDWTMPPGAVSYDVFLGTSATTVAQATTGTAGIYKGRVTLDEYAATGFTSGTTNYWRIDFRFADGTVFKGTVWNFTLVTEQDPMADTWVATDGLDRSIPTFAQAGPPRDDRPTAIFYFLWHNKNSLGSDGPRDNTKEIARLGGYTDKNVPWADNPLWMTGASGRSWYWGEPEAGYYASDDEWVIRRHITLLTAAGVDILAFDNTNGQPESYQQSWVKIAETIRKMRKEGMKIDLKFLFLTHGGTGGSPATITWLYENLYKPGLYPELWLMWDGKPAIIGYPDGLVPGETPLSQEVRNFFTLRTGWANGGGGANDWQWIDTPTPQNWGYPTGRADIPEQVPVACGGWGNGNLGRSNFNRTQPAYDNFHLATARTEGQGKFFSEQMNYGLKLDPKLMFITGWNEWWAGAWTAPAPGGGYNILDNPCAAGERYFVDCYTAEYSRDIEPMKGGFGDNYYYQMVAANRLRKGVRPIPNASLALPAAPTDWAAVGPVYYDAPDETLPRNWNGTFSNMPIYTNTTGRNDFRVLKVARDATYLYFQAETKANVTTAAGSNWMNLYLDTDANPATGWEGYDYVINSGGSGQIKSLAGPGWNPLAAGSATVTVTGNKIVIRVARAALGLGADPLKLDFHWTDNLQTAGDIADFGISGDSAPERRFNYRYQTAPTQSTALREDGFENGQQSSWGETFNAGSQWQIATTLPYGGTKCLIGSGKTGGTDASGTLINRTSTAGLNSFRTAFRYKLANVQDAQNILVYFRNNLGQWVAVREIGRDQFHTTGQAWGYDERQNVWLYFTDSRQNTGADAAYFHADFAVHIQIKTLTSATQTIAIDDFGVTGLQPITAPAAATTPTPAHNATAVPVATALSWSPGANGVSQQVYFGSPGNLQLLASVDGSAATQPVTLTASTTYSWRIDTTNPAGVTAGPVWTFTTAAPPNQSPVLAVIANRLVVAGQTVTFTASASDPDLPVQQLAFSLQGGPSGASMDPTSGGFTWRPAQAQAPGTYPITVTVVDNGSPPLAAQRSFTVQVSPPARPTITSSGLDAMGVFKFQVTGDPGPDYRVWSSDDMKSWSLLRTIPEAVPPFWFQDTDAKNYPRRFYKLDLGP